jgi:hypothetical protein
MPRWAKILAWVLGSIVALCFVIAIFAPTPPPQPAQPETQSSAQAPAVAPAPAAQASEDQTIIKTTDLALSQAYADNEVAAQAKYGDKTLWVKGRITGITLDFFNDPVIAMRGTNEFLPAQAKFPDDAKDSLSKLHKGDLVTMQCKEITEVVSAPMLSDCSLMDNSVR